MGIDNLNDLELGEYECVTGYPALEGQTDAYYKSYGKQYDKEQCDTAKTNAEGGNYELI